MSARHVSLTPHGPKISPIVPGLMNLGAWQLTAAERLRWIEAAMDLGLNTFDHADIYGDYTCEQLFGEALALEPGMRERLQIVTKCGIGLISANRPSHEVKHYDTSREHILHSVERSLDNFQTDRIDLLLIHRPDPLMDAGAVADAFVTLREQGKVLHFGVSNFAPAQYELLADTLPFPLVTNQVACSVAQMEAIHDGTFDQLQRLGVRPMVWSPLAGGAIFRDDTSRSARLRQALEEIGSDVGAGIDQVALAWVLRLPAGPIPVLGTGKIERLRRAVDALQIELTRQQWFRIWQASTGREVP